MSRLRSTLAIIGIAAACLAATVPRSDAAAQPDPAADKLNVDSVQVNLSLHPAFQFVIAIPTVLRFESAAVEGQSYLHIWAYSRVDSLQARITQASNYLADRPGIFTPLIEPPNSRPVLGYVDRLQFRRALEQALRDLRPERRLSYNRRLT